MNLNQEFIPGKSFHLLFRVDEKCVNQFAVLTGDFSSLHINKFYGRKSVFRQNVIHGMLPVSQISKIELFESNKYQFSLKRITGKFLKPAFYDDELKLTAEISKTDESESSISLVYTIHNTNKNSIITKGVLEIVVSEKNNNDFHNITQNSISKALVITEEENVKNFEDFSEGEKASINFTILNEHISQFFSICSGNNILRKSGAHLTVIQKEFILNLLSVSLLSTLVGMKIPGKYATFMDFDITFKKNIVLKEKQSLNCEISFISEAARALVLNVNISSNEKVEIAHGKLTVKVNNPPIIMPTLNELNFANQKINLNDKVVLITGSSRGTGEVIAKLFAVYGARVIINYFQSKENATRIVDEITDFGGNAIAIKADVRDLSEVRKMVSESVIKFGTIDILVNNAVGDFIPKNISELTWNDIQLELNVTLKGAFNCCQEVIPIMLKKREGKIINISTLAVEVPPLKQTKYIIAKSALNGLTKSLAMEYASNNIQINSVVPGFIETDLTNFLSKENIDELKNQTPMKRHANPVEVAKAVIFLASSLSSYTTGQKIFVTGGLPPFY